MLSNRKLVSHLNGIFNVHTRQIEPWNCKRQKEYATQMTCTFGYLKDVYEVLLAAIIYRKNALTSEGQQQGSVGVAMVEG